MSLFWIFIIGFIGFALFVALMATGAIFRGKTLKGSCGGLNAVMDEEGKAVCGTCGVEVNKIQSKEKDGNCAPEQV